MAEKREYYEVLGVARDASDDDIRRAYRKLALTNHPDRNPGDASAEQRFKEATEAYSVISDPEKRATYDRFGHAGLSAGGFDFSGAGIGDIFGRFQDMFADFFGEGFGGGRRRAERGSDVRIETTISLASAMTGCKEEVTVQGPAPCEECRGNGCAPGTSPQACLQCGGSGQVTNQRGFILFSTTCGRCGGQGKVVSTPCKVCKGRGVTERRRRVVVTFPAGIDSGQRLRVPGQGMPGLNASPPGDLYVDISLAEDARFERDGNDLVTRERVSFAQAVLGTECTIELPDGTPVRIEVPSGTQPGKVLSVRGRGMPVINSRHDRGNLNVVIDVNVPKKVNRKARKLLEELDAELASE